MRLFCLMPEGERVVVGVGLVGREDGAITLCGSDVADSQFRQSGGMSDGWGDPGSRAACAAEARLRTTGVAAAAGIDRGKGTYHGNICRKIQTKWGTAHHGCGCGG